MIEIEQLYHLVAYDKYQTLSKAAKELYISQPVLTRSMQKLEQELDVELFNRTKNSITLNKTGILAVELANKILDNLEKMTDQIKSFDRTQHIISIGSCAPAPNIYLAQMATAIFEDKTIQSEIKNTDDLLEKLKNKDYHLIILPYQINDELIESIAFMEEQLYFALPADHRLANNHSLKFKDMDGEKMLLMSNIGFWYQIHLQTMLHSRFLLQQDRSVFHDLVELSSLPSFTSDYMVKINDNPKNRKCIPIDDPEAKATFYCCYLKENEKLLKPLLYQLIKKYQTNKQKNRSLIYSSCSY